MKLSELIENAKTTLELYGDGEVYQVGDCGEHYTDFSFSDTGFWGYDEMETEKNHIEWMQVFLIKNTN